MAAPKRNALGRGLDALISMEDVRAQGSSSINEIELSMIFPNPDQPRKEFDPVALSELADSIKSLGIITPITVQKNSDTDYMIIAGERRFRASQMAGLRTIPAYVRDVSDQTILEMALTENLQREDLNSIEIALAYQNIMEQYSLTQEKVSERVGVNRTTVTNYLRLLRLPAEVQMGIRDKKIDMGHARALISINDPQMLLRVYEDIVQYGLSVRKVEDMARAYNNGESVEKVLNDAKKEKIEGLNKRSKPKTEIQEEHLLIQKQLTSLFHTKVKFAYNDKGKGSISIPFTSDDELEHIVKVLDSLNK